MYMSPERITSEPYSFPADIWGLGLSLMTVALGRFPLNAAGGYWGLVRSIKNEPCPSLPRARFSAELVDFVDACLAKDPRLRPSADALLEHPFILRYRGACVLPHTSCTVRACASPFCFRACVRA